MVKDTKSTKKNKKPNKKSKKSKYVFTQEDYNSDNGMMTYIWGPSLWHSLHTMSFNYPVKPTDKQKKEYLEFFKSLKNVLPCKYCRQNYIENIKVIKLNKSTMKNRNTLSRWLYNLHNHINKQLGKNINITYEEVRDRYESFRSRCSLTDKKTTSSKKSKEKGCLEPISGIKTKCILKIVPKDKKCDTIQPLNPQIKCYCSDNWIQFNQQYITKSNKSLVCIHYLFII